MATIAFNLYWFIRHGHPCFIKEGPSRETQEDLTTNNTKSTKEIL
jgi:hypothetical protein